jgi:hypothetical protein
MVGICYKLPLRLQQWGLELILSTIVAGFVMLFFVFAIMYYAIHAVYFWKLERLYERNPRLAVKYFMMNYYV